MKTYRILYLITLFLIFHTASFALDKRGDDITDRHKFDVAKMLTSIVKSEVSGGYVKVFSIEASRRDVIINASIGMSYFPFREDNIEAIADSVRSCLPEKYEKATVTVITDKHKISELIPFPLREAPDARREKKERKVYDSFIRFTNPTSQPLVQNTTAINQPTRGLKNRHIALWQSHGRYFNQKVDDWIWQRIRLWQTCEDLYTQSYILPYLVPMLENAGANVFMPRERDLQKREIIVDRDNTVGFGSSYTETNGKFDWRDGAQGFAHTQKVYTDQQNPFKMGSSRIVNTCDDRNATSNATWNARFSERGTYAVYVSYATSSNSCTKARYTVHHLGGNTDFVVNQKMGGGTWIYLGTFDFAAGKSPVVTLSNYSTDANTLISADAVKIGGGYGNIARETCDSLQLEDREYRPKVSGDPRFCEAARYWLQWAGFEPEVYRVKEGTDDYKDDYISRGEWVNALMGGSLRRPNYQGLSIPIDMALAFHSDSGYRLDDDIIGTLGIFYTKENYGKFYNNGGDRYHSRDLTDMVMTEIVQDIRREWEPDWMRRGMWNRSYFEARVPSAPTMLLELLSHQNFADMRYGSDPRFKFMISRAIYKGVLKYISAQYKQDDYVVQPLPVEQFSSQISNNGEVTLKWSPKQDTTEVTAQPNGYILYTRIGDGAFDNGRRINETTTTIQQEPNKIYSYKVTAINNGGESFPSEILAAYHHSNSPATVLIVNGFDRVSAPPSFRNDSLAGFDHKADRGVPYLRDICYIGEQFRYDMAFANDSDENKILGASRSDYEGTIVGGNTFDYPYLHGVAIANSGYSFCSTSRTAVENNEVKLSDYNAVDYIVGKQLAIETGRGTRGVEFRTLSTPMQRIIKEYLDQNGAIFLSGSYLASDLAMGKYSTLEDNSFLEEVLHVKYLSKGLPQRQLLNVVDPYGNFFGGEYSFVSDICEEHYSLESVDMLSPASDKATQLMQYHDKSGAAMVGSKGTGRTLVLGLPFEMISTDNQRDQMMYDILDFLTENK